MTRLLTIRNALIASILLAVIGFAFLRGSFADRRSLVASAIQFVPPPPPDLGEPSGRPEGGGSRGCDAIALVPQTTVGQWGQTTEAHPTFWFRLAVGRNLTSGDRLAFKLMDETNQVVYQSEFAAPAVAPGVVKFALPNSTPALQVNQLYRWEFSIRCDAATIEDIPGLVQGSIQRVELSEAIANTLTTPTAPLDRAKLYASQGIWYDAMTTLGNELQPSNSPNPEIQTAWNRLLVQINLSNLESVPLVSCCSTR
ncbi:MAG: DUF928 domain-containing protein [Oculatellaceae cyanobacterium Prado106]|jgi:hypothetical protein|nr:DUF928 domain-containing protein [Oculatellaceae cyanobacterium Prado106]